MECIAGNIKTGVNLSSFKRRLKKKKCHTVILICKSFIIIIIELYIVLFYFITDILTSFYIVD